MTRNKRQRNIARILALVLCIGAVLPCFVFPAYGLIDMDEADRVIKGQGFMESDIDRWTNKDSNIPWERKTYVREGNGIIYGENGQYVMIDGTVGTANIYQYYVQMQNEEGIIKEEKRIFTHIYITIWITDENVNGAAWPLGYNIDVYFGNGLGQYSTYTMKMMPEQLGIYDKPEPPLYDWYLPEYVDYQKEIQASGRRELYFERDESITLSQDVANLIAATYGSTYPYYYYEYNYGNYVLLSRDNLRMSANGYITNTDIPYYVMTQRQDNIILDLRYIEENRVDVYTTEYDNESGILRLAVPAEEPRLLQYLPAYYNGAVNEYSSFWTEAWGTNQEFAEWHTYNDAISGLGEIPEPSPEPSPSPSPSPESPGEEAAGIAEDLVNQEIEVDESALSLLVLVVNFISVPAVAGGVAILIVTMILIALMVKGRGG